MPRLIGKPSKAPVYVGITLLIAIVGAVGLEYYGVVDLVPGFGSDRHPIGRSARLLDPLKYSPQQSPVS